jgi:hypothetical protein
VSAARSFGLACAAACAASAGDLAMLLVSTAQHFALVVPTPLALLALAALLGVAGIPLYAIGYAAAARRVCADSPGAARLVRLAGAGTAGIGALIHGTTALAIYDSLALSTSEPTLDPLAAVAQSTALIALWSAAGLCFVAASLPVLWHALRGPEKWALANPLVATLALSTLGASFELGRWFLVPAAPNLAHVVFFALGARAVAGAARA